MKKHLTNAQLIEILMKRDPNKEVDFMVDFSTWHMESYYAEITDTDGLCYVEKDNQLVVNIGEIEY